MTGRNFMNWKKVTLCLGVCVWLCPALQAQKTKALTQGVEYALEREVFNRAKLPTLLDGLRNRFTGRLGPSGKLNVYTGGNPSHVLTLSQDGKITEVFPQTPVRSVMDFSKPYPARVRVRKVLQSPGEFDNRILRRPEGFYSVVTPGSGGVERIALSARSLISKAIPIKDQDAFDLAAYFHMAAELDKHFTRYQDSWVAVSPTVLADITEQTQQFKNNWSQICFQWGSGGREMPLSVMFALNTVQIQTWMLVNEGRFPQSLIGGTEGSAVKLFDFMINSLTDPKTAAIPGMQALSEHLIYLRLVGKDMLTPLQVVELVKAQVAGGARVPGSSTSERVDMTENWLAYELNYLETLRRAKLLSIAAGKDTDQVVQLLKDFQERGYIYQQMLQTIPEYAHGGLTLNVPSRSRSEWELALEDWVRKRREAGLDTSPRTCVAGRFGLPVNFNDLTAEEQEEVLLGTYLTIQ